MPTFTHVPTPTVDMTATQQYSDFMAYVQKFRDNRVIPVTGGTYYRLDDFMDMWAQINWYQRSVTNVSTSNFLLRSHIAWESASKTPNPSGCGFIIHEQPNEDHYLLFVSTFGYVYLFGSRKGETNYIGQVYHGKISSSGDGDLTLIVQGTQFKVYWNDKYLGALVGYDNMMLSGRLGMSIVSGTNIDYGTRCEMTGIEILNFDE